MRSSGQAVNWLPYIFLAPAGLYLLVFQGIPLVQELFLSFTSTSLLAPQNHTFVGLANYTTLFSNKQFLGTIWVTFVYTVSCVVLAIGLGFVTALLLDTPFKGRAIARTMITIPWAAPPVAVALIATWIFNAQYGIFNHAQRALGIPAYEGWLDNPKFALPAILIVTVWQIFPFSSVVLLAALQGVPRELREAAQIDGANAFEVLVNVVWPTLRPTVVLLSLFVTIWSLRRFDLIWLLTQGGPIGSTNTLVIDLYQKAFVSRDLGAAAAVGMVGLAVAMVITLFYVRASQRADNAGR
jgi:multiple sugar transport system permease protein